MSITKYTNFDTIDINKSNQGEFLMQDDKFIVTKNEVEDELREVFINGKFVINRQPNRRAEERTIERWSDIYFYERINII